MLEPGLKLAVVDDVSCTLTTVEYLLYLSVGSTNTSVVVSTSNAHATQNSLQNTSKTQKKQHLDVTTLYIYVLATGDNEQTNKTS